MKSISSYYCSCAMPRAVAVEATGVTGKLLKLSEQRERNTLPPFRAVSQRGLSSRRPSSGGSAASLAGHLSQAQGGRCPFLTWARPGCHVYTAVAGRARRLGDSSLLSGSGERLPYSGCVR